MAGKGSKNSSGLPSTGRIFVKGLLMAVIIFFIVALSEVMVRGDQDRVDYGVKYADQMHEYCRQQVEAGDDAALLEAITLYELYGEDYAEYREITEEKIAALEAADAEAAH